MDALCAALFEASVCFRILQRPVRTIEPCVGISAYRELSRVGRFPYESDVYDTERGLRPFWDARIAESSDATVNLHFGDAGDVLQIDTDSLDGEMLLAGPPCQHVNQSGLRLGVRDDRHQVFECLCDWIIELAWRGVLVPFSLETTLKF